MTKNFLASAAMAALAMGLALPASANTLFFQMNPNIDTGGSRSVFVFGSMESTLTPLMLDIERDHPGIRVFSLPSVDHPVRGRHIELGVKGASADLPAAFDALMAGLARFADIEVRTE